MLNLTNNPATDMAPTRSPNLLWIACQSERHENWDICLVNGDGSETNSSPAARPTTRIPTGHTIACGSSISRIAKGQWETYALLADGQREIRVSDDVSADEAPAWTATASG